MRWRASGEWRDILDFVGSVGHEVVPVGHCDLGIPQSEDVSELELLWVLASLMYDLVQDDTLLESLVGQPVGKSGRQLFLDQIVQSESESFSLIR